MILPEQLKNSGIKYILSIGRRQPMHIGHKRSLAKILAISNVKLIYVIGSSNIKGDPLFDPISNPLNLAQQIEQFKQVFPDGNAIFLPIEDVPDISKWGPMIVADLKELSIDPMDCAIHFIGKPEDKIVDPCEFVLENGKKEALLPGQWLIEVLSFYGFTMWFDNELPVELHISARKLRQLDLINLSSEHEEILAAPEYIREIATKARLFNPELSDEAISLYDLSLARIKDF